MRYIRKYLSIFIVHRHGLDVCIWSLVHPRCVQLFRENTGPFVWFFRLVHNSGSSVVEGELGSNS